MRSRLSLSLSDVSYQSFAAPALFPSYLCLSLSHASGHRILCPSQGIGTQGCSNVSSIGEQRCVTEDTLRVCSEHTRDSLNSQYFLWSLIAFSSLCSSVSYRRKGYSSVLFSPTAKLSARNDQETRRFYGSYVRSWNIVRSWLSK